MEFKFNIRFVDVFLFIVFCGAAYSWYEGNKLHDKDFSSVDAIYHIAEACFLMLVAQVLVSLCRQ